MSAGSWPELQVPRSAGDGLSPVGRPHLALWDSQQELGWDMEERRGRPGLCALSRRAAARSWRGSGVRGLGESAGGASKIPAQSTTGQSCREQNSQALVRAKMLKKILGD